MNFLRSSKLLFREGSMIESFLHVRDLLLSLVLKNFPEITFPIPNNNLMYKMVINFDLCVCVCVCV